jgi:glycosyltransferase involved in cell wall biosynthesis
MRSKPLVTIVMCAYNTRPYIRQAVSSILQQSYKNIELIISDDRSTDGTWPWLVKHLSSHRQVRLYRQERNIGYVANKNFAMSCATGDFVSQCDSDDFYELTLVEQQIDIIAKHADISMVACGYHIVSNQGRTVRTEACPEDMIFRKYPNRPYPFWFPSILAAREVYDKVGEFSSLFGGVGDDLYWTVKANERYPIYCLSQPLYNYRQLRGSVSRLLDDKRKLTAPGLLTELLRQRLETGTDWIQEENTEAIICYEQGLLNDRKFMAEQYRSWATKSLDFGDISGVLSLLSRAVWLHPLNATLPRTLFYYLRVRLDNVLDSLSRRHQA